MAEFTVNAKNFVETLTVLSSIIHPKKLNYLRSKC